MAKKETFEGEVSSAYGKKLDTAIRISGEYDKLDKTDIESVKTSKEWPSDEDIIKGYINPRRLAAAKAKATTEALDAAGIKKPEADDPRVVYRNLVKNMVLGGMAEDEARGMARTILGDKLNGIDVE